MARRTTRRELIGAAAPLGRDRRLLARTLRIQTLGLWTYDRVLDHGRLEPDARRIILRLRGYEREHVAVLTRHLAAPGHLALPTWSTTSAAAELDRHGIGASVGGLGTQHDCLRLLIDVESLIEAAWFAAIGGLSDPTLATLAAQIMACEAQHWTVLSGLSHHEDPKMTVPYPFVRGSSAY